MDIHGAKDYITSRLRLESLPDLFYHSVEHTLDVYEAAGRLADLEGISGDAKTIILTAALFHDTGMLTGYADHEKSSAAMALEILPRFEYSAEETKQVSDLILVTRLPQQAVSPEEQVLCDADLDYLGRDDFFIHSFQLQLEWNRNRIRETNLRQWLEIQVDFLSGHCYFTNAARRMRDAGKAKNLAEIKKILNTFEQS
jgi:predicted metal-dependent HD superfamily phosphohydrolase